MEREMGITAAEEGPESSPLPPGSTRPSSMAGIAVLARISNLTSGAVFDTII